jgi:hypothetical protein
MPYDIQELENSIHEQMDIIMNAMQTIRSMATDLRNEVRQDISDVQTQFTIRRTVIRRIRRQQLQILPNSQLEPNTSNSALIPPTPPLNPTFPLIEYSLNENEDHCRDGCPICLKKVKMKSFVKTNCKHLFCFQCITKCLKTHKYGNYKCPMCREDVTHLYINYDKNLEKIIKMTNGQTAATMITETV